MKERGVQADYVFFYAYVQPPAPEGGNIWSAVDETIRPNSKYFQAIYSNSNRLA